MVSLVWSCQTQVQVTAAKVRVGKAQVQVTEAKVRVGKAKVHVGKAQTQVAEAQVQASKVRAYGLLRISVLLPVDCRLADPIPWSCCLRWSLLSASCSSIAVLVDGSSDPCCRTRACHAPVSPSLWFFLSATMSGCSKSVQTSSAQSASVPASPSSGSLSPQHLTRPPSPLLLWRCS